MNNFGVARSFLGNRDNNMRYVALNILARVVAVDLAAVQRHRATVVDCVKDADVSIRRCACTVAAALLGGSVLLTMHSCYMCGGSFA